MSGISHSHLSSAAQSYTVFSSFKVLCSQSPRLSWCLIWLAKFFPSLFFENFVLVCNELWPDIPQFPPTPPYPHFIMSSSSDCLSSSLIIYQAQLAAHMCKVMGPIHWSIGTSWWPHPQWNIIFIISSSTWDLLCPHMSLSSSILCSCQSIVPSLFHTIMNT